MQLTDEFKNRLRQEVETLEKKTTVEFVPVITESSRDFLPGPLAFITWSFRPAYHFLPRKMELFAVERAAQAAFFAHEVFATRERTGVLIYVSVLERAVFLLADKGLLEKFPASEWSELGQHLAKDFSEKNPGESFFQALRALEPRLISNFPASHDNPNELKDHLRT